MYKSKLYAKCNRYGQKIVNYVVEKYFKKVEWNINDDYSILDVGCGEGTTLKNIIIPALPLKNTLITGIDQSEEMIKEAKKLFKEENVKFITVSIEDEHFDKKVKSKFDHILSFNCLHFVTNQNICFSNLHKVLKPNGKIFIVRTLYPPLFKVFDKTAEQLQRPEYLNKKLFCNFYQHVEKDDVIEETKKFLNTKGFTNVEVSIEPIRSHSFRIEEFLLWTIVLNPFWKNIPEEELKMYLKNFCPGVFSMPGIIMNYNNDDTITMTWEVDYLVISGTKIF